MTLADYRDGIHVNEKGQKVIAEYLNRCIEEIYKKKYKGMYKKFGETIKV